MKARVLTRAVVPALLLAVLAAGAAAPGQAASPDPISGEWAAAFEFAGGVGHAKGKWSAKKRASQSQRR